MLSSEPSNLGAGHVAGVQTIMSARLPIIKLVDCGTGIECDLSIENRDGIVKSQIVYIISRIDGRFQKLSFMEHGGDLNEAVNAHFREGDVHRSFKPSLLLDRSYSRDLYNRIGSALTGRAPSPSHPGEVTGVPVGFNASNEQPYLSGQMPTIPDVARTDLDASRYGNDVEEEMIQAAIEASKREAEMGSPNVQNSTPNVSPGNGLPVEKIPEENSDFDRAVSLSLKTAEQEKAIREMQLNDRNQDPLLFTRQSQFILLSSRHVESNTIHVLKPHLYLLLVFKETLDIYIYIYIFFFLCYALLIASMHF
ncbi:plant UBX domain-containing protein 9 isoform X3 [Rosa chinensis]|uniref:plant UBX domain-containing protein 9 isoform X3 n=1 Tax=Rosa chinensis TaxID=74649 RepID=UPI001AD923D9|nr:plant UBX domain-containing protein 9 isoform X3 [Rosa chinensis]